MNMVIKVILFNESQRSTLCEIREWSEFDEECLSALEQEIRASIISEEQTKIYLKLSKSREADCLRYKSILKPRRVLSYAETNKKIKILPGTMSFRSKSDRELGLNKHGRALVCNRECKNREMQNQEWELVESMDDVDEGYLDVFAIDGIAKHHQVL